MEGTILRRNRKMGGEILQEKPKGQARCSLIGKVLISNSLYCEETSSGLNCILMYDI